MINTPTEAWQKQNGQMKTHCDDDLLIEKKKLGIVKKNLVMMICSELSEQGVLLIEKKERS